MVTGYARPVTNRTEITRLQNALTPWVDMTIDTAADTVLAIHPRKHHRLPAHPRNLNHQSPTLPPGTSRPSSIRRPPAVSSAPPTSDGEHTTVPHQQHLATAYDLIYVHAAGKDYQTEAEQIAALIRQRNPAAVSLLDVACGTGLHLSLLRHAFTHVEGLEYSEAMRAAALARLDGITVHAGDMRDFHLGADSTPSPACSPPSAT